MPTVAKLEKLEALIERLEPIAEKHRGELIEAPHWNSLVDSVIEVARSVLADDKTEEVPPHEHSDQVGLTWLDTKLRGLILEGGLNDPGSESQLFKLNREIDVLSKQFDQLRDSLSQLKSDLNGVSTRDLMRESDMTRVSRKIDGIADAREDVTNLRQTLRTLETDVKRAVEFGQTVVRDGETINIADMLTRVERVETLRADLTNTEGKVFNANDFEKRLVELQNTLVTEEELDEVLKTVRDQVGSDLRSSVLEETREIAQKVTTEAMEPIKNELLGQVKEQMDSISSSIDTRVNDATSDLAANLSNTLQKETQTEIDRRMNLLKAEITQESETNLGNFSKSIDQRFSSFQDDVGERISSGIATQLEGTLKDFETRLNESDTRITELSNRTDENIEQSKANATRIEQTRLELLAADASSRSSVSKQLSEMEKNLNESLTAKTNSLRDTLNEDLNISMNQKITDLEARLSKTASESARVETKLQTNELRADVNDIVQNQMTVLQKDLEASIEKRFTSNNSRLNGLVAEEVARSTSDLNKRIRTEIEAIETERKRNIETNERSTTTTRTRSGTR
ncbi:MAG: hypothetical protein G3M70_05200 [Candidatus Nitronauta litoralis]|uniref:Uncharacterized protein n=1 Tax=Candidatus Nitronauta litoralis TaxID=2705533 RepID=A0A7T0BUQ3_9BACT|nr:MAG: hypothetical protein G3M70_05200 [Candidatus Nitronauta litoralis]